MKHELAEKHECLHIPHSAWCALHLCTMHVEIKLWNWQHADWSQTLFRIPD